MNGEIESTTLKIVEHLRGHVESIVYYPYAFAGAGLLIVLNENAGFFPNAVAKIYSCVPPGIKLFCLQKHELFQLSIPGQFLDLVRGVPSDHPHVAFWVKYKSSLLYGADIRDHIRLPSDTRELLKIHIERCIFYLRNTRILQLLMEKKYLALIEELDKHLRHVMMTALLANDEWAVNGETVPALFQTLYPDNALKQIWMEFNALLSGVEVSDEVLNRERAFEAVWLFESFLKRLEAHLL
jgi:hypothetical protein